MKAPMLQPIRDISRTRRYALKACLLMATITCALLMRVSTASAQVGNRIPSTKAFDAGCSSAELGGIDVTIDYLVGSKTFTVPSPARLDPEWAVVVSDSSKLALDQPPQIVEGTVPLPSIGAGSTVGNDYQAAAEVAEEDMAWTHYTHDYTFKLVPDSPTYDNVLTYYHNSDGTIGMKT